MKLIKLFTLILIMPFINGVLKAQSEIPIELLEIIVPINGPTIEPDILDDDSPVLLSCPKISPLYNDSSFFMINPNSIEKVVRVNFIVFQKNDGSGNFQADDPEHIKIFDDFELALNNCFKNLHQICGLINKDAKIRFVCTPTFVRDSNLWKGIGVSQWVQTFENTPGSPSGINVLFYINESAYIKNIIENDSTYYYGQDIWSANLPNSTNFDQASRINAPDLFVKHHWMKNWVTVHTGLPWIPTIYNWFIGSMSSSALGHEIGHSLGLLDIFYPLNNCDSANIMRQQFGGGRNYLSDTQINKIHNSLAVTSVRKYVNDPTALDVPLVITDTKFIDFDVKLYRDIIIESGAQLTITCKVLMPSSGKITIKPGGKLALDGGILTSSCPYKLWYGILVAGNDTLPQTPESNQGVLELKNGAIIENANNAIATYGLDLNGNISWSSFGGIIKADNTTFRNNRRSIEFMKYPPNGTNPVPQNVSYFNNCKFIVNDNNLFGNRPLWSQITMWAVTGVQIKGCEFENNMAFKSPHLRAIYTESAGYIVDEFCTAYNNRCICIAGQKPSSFKGFNNAIGGVITSLQYAIRIDRSNFQNNITGIKFAGISTPRITRLNMLLNANQTGIYLDACTGYKVEENTISGVRQSSTGIQVHRPGIDENQISNNNVSSTNYGSLVTAPIAERGVNATGLQFLRNDLSNNNYDIGVFHPGRVRTSQGSSICAAGNLFGDISTWNFVISTNTFQQTNYYYDPSVSRSEPVRRSSLVYLIPTTSTMCLSVSEICKPTKRKSETSEQFFAEYQELNRRYAEMLRYYYEKGYDKILDDYYNGITIEDEILLQEAMAYLESMMWLTEYMGELSKEALFILKTDSIIDLYQIRDWYDEMYNLSAKYSLAETYYQLDNYEEGFRTLSLIPEMYKLSENEQIEHHNYFSLFTFKNDIRQSGRTIAQLNEDEVEQLVNFAFASHGLSSVMARGTLCFFYDICLEEEIDKKIDIGTIGKNENENQGNLSSQDSKSKLENITLYPNPTTGELTITNYKLEITNIEIFDVYGRKLQSTPEFNSGVKLQSKIVIDIAHLNSGIYFVKIATEQDEVVKKVIKQ